MPSAYKLMDASFWKQELRFERLQKWRRGPALLRVERPTRLDRARRLGYRAKPGVGVVRARVRRGGRRKMRFKGGRKTKHMGVNRMTPAKSIQRIAEERVARRFPNMEVLNSYWVADDGRHQWFEVIVVDRASPEVQADPRLAPAARRRGRAFRALTSAGQRARGLP
ncbi:MAG: 50S ribosomal protein L15e [Halobacteria archaeon]